MDTLYPGSLPWLTAGNSWQPRPAKILEKSQEKKVKKNEKKSRSLAFLPSAFPLLSIQLNPRGPDACC